jgi:signal transduction histidine kinase
VHARQPGSASSEIVAVVQVARPMHTITETMDGLITLLVAGSGLSMLIAFIAGFWLAGKAVEPIKLNLDYQKQFVSDASHELRTPVTVIRTAAESMLRQTEAAPPRIQGLAEDIVSETVQLQRLVEDLGVLTHADAGTRKLRLEPVDLETLLAEVATSARLVGQAAGVVVDITTGAAGEVNGDAVRLRQLFTILVDNAVKFSPTGAVVRVAAVTRQNRLLVQVRDQGPGIPEADLPRIFQRFYRGAADRNLEGSGLGLAIAKWIVEQHRGTISVRSVVGEGSEFSVELPLAVERASAAEAPR